MEITFFDVTIIKLNVLPNSNAKELMNIITKMNALYESVYNLLVYERQHCEGR